MQTGNKSYRLRFSQIKVVVLLNNGYFDGIASLVPGILLGVYCSRSANLTPCMAKSQALSGNRSIGREVGMCLHDNIIESVVPESKQLTCIARRCEHPSHS